MAVLHSRPWKKAFLVGGLPMCREFNTFRCPLGELGHQINELLDSPRGVGNFLGSDKLKEDSAKLVMRSVLLLS